MKKILEDLFLCKENFCLDKCSKYKKFIFWIKINKRHNMYTFSENGQSYGVCKHLPSDKKNQVKN